jgi:hypothetical protein
MACSSHQIPAPRIQSKKLAREVRPVAGWCAAWCVMMMCDVGGAAMADCALPDACEDGSRLGAGRNDCRLDELALRPWLAIYSRAVPVCAARDALLGDGAAGLRCGPR